MLDVNGYLESVFPVRSFCRNLYYIFFLTFENLNFVPINLRYNSTCVTINQKYIVPFILSDAIIALLFLGVC